MGCIVRVSGGAARLQTVELKNLATVHGTQTQMLAALSTRASSAVSHVCACNCGADL